MVTLTRPHETPNLARGNEIVAENLRAVQAIYMAAMLEEVKLFQVVDRLAQLFQQGILTLNRIISWLAANLSRLQPNTERPFLRFRKSANPPGP